MVVYVFKWTKAHPDLLLFKEIDPKHYNDLKFAISTTVTKMARDFPTVDGDTLLKLGLARFLQGFTEHLPGHLKRAEAATGMKSSNKETKDRARRLNELHKALDAAIKAKPEFLSTPFSYDAWKSENERNTPIQVGFLTMPHWYRNYELWPLFVRTLKKARHYTELTGKVE